MLDFITWTASPDIISGHLATVRWYGLMFAIGFWAGYEVVWREFRHEGAPERWVASLFFYVIVATVVGARLGHVFFYDWDYYSRHLSEIPKIWEGGLASHGGVIGILIAIWLYSRWVTKRSMLWTLDRLVVPVGLVAALIRLGNLFNHEIYGGPTSLPWGFRFVDNVNEWMQGAPPVFTVPCHPTQLYEALCYLLVFGLCMWMYWKRNDQERPGLIFGVFMLGIFLARFVIEYVKNVQEPWEIAMRARLGLDMGQLLSIPFIVLGIWLIVRACRRQRLTIEFPNRFADAKDEEKRKA
ncbi:MAG: prolipoprotein diacylglyceryl transferase [Sodaliphilus pleomorphus]|jgi:prolipoprotein diacylglyceryl transferase|uniref:Phosphatidylglycerol--prolipoprotein diacylglyceryl transferase n=1 Tax=Sodaliphilus pleomorphus TaxID=2606626 RepID=A0A6L5XG20_9BACT|nr:prolipoprotein diacylglyceryl transferase [Sodaliphilus pleomorphus]MCI5981248.1 prolipoprotein diacylglyceryl transferase [Muribaculaceae bacterium]MDY6252839.1 prolipoprotein diacylglyceryl transferase [Bacteroidales bacterium]MCI6170158.1 prolipoprotein diacylglyceryl transferase [Muribaculaceae bacterium]MDD6686850.1 prolipoprotein diacylglyceryl transferase [Sodaliphilus pleomorphus]MDD7065976.1 prolipoprotein diacylglyceryl transferase [Sodaliphilus pleomorphus]